MKITLKTNIDTTCLFIGEKEYTKFLDSGDFTFKTDLKKFCMVCYPIEEYDDKTYLPVSTVFTVDNDNLACNSNYFKIDKSDDTTTITINYPFITLKSKPEEIKEPESKVKSLFSFEDNNDSFSITLNEKLKQLNLLKNDVNILTINSFIDYEIDEVNKEIKILVDTEKTTTSLKGLVVVYSLKTGSKIDEFFVSI